MMTSAYRQRMDAANLAAAHQSVQDAAKSILANLKSIENYLYWSLDPEEPEGERSYLCRNMLEYAHELVDQAHQFRLHVCANPPQPEPDDAA
jgi:hypothetical protein